MTTWSDLEMVKKHTSSSHPAPYTPFATAARQGGMVAVNLVDSCSLGPESLECETGCRLWMWFLQPLRLHSTGCPFRSTPARPCGVGGGRCFSIILAVLECEVGYYVGQCRINEIFLENIQTHNCKGHLHHDISADAYSFKCIIRALTKSLLIFVMPSHFILLCKYNL